MLKDKLNDWIDLDIAAYELAVDMGIMTYENKFATDVKWVFWSNNPLGNTLYGFLVDLVKTGVLERNDDDKVRWNQSYDFTSKDT